MDLKGIPKTELIIEFKTQQIAIVNENGWKIWITLEDLEKILSEEPMRKINII